MSYSKGQEKWSSVRIADSKKSSLKVENHVSIHSNLSLNGLEQKQGKEVCRMSKDMNKMKFKRTIVFHRHKDS